MFPRQLLWQRRLFCCRPDLVLDSSIKLKPLWLLLIYASTLTGTNSCMQTHSIREIKWWSISWRRLSATSSANGQSDYWTKCIGWCLTHRFTAPPEWSTDLLEPRLSVAYCFPHFPGTQIDLSPKELQDDGQWSTYKNRDRKKIVRIETQGLTLTILIMRLSSS